MKYRIFLLTGSFSFGGTERYLDILTRNLDNRTFSIKIGCFDDKGPFYPDTGDAPEIFAFRKFPRVIQNLNVLLKLICYLKNERFDILYSTHYQTNVYLAIASLFRRKSIFISGYRGLNSDRGRLFSIINTFVVKVSSKIIVNSMASSETIRKRTDVNKEKIRVIYNGIETVTRDSSPSETRRITGVRKKIKSNFVIGTVGRLHSIKGQKYLLEAFKLLCQDYDNISLLIAGDGEDRSDLEILAENLCIADKVEFLGFVHDPDLVLNFLDIFVLPSLSESFPNALLEAMRKGLPCVASSVGGIPEIIRQMVSGLLVTPGDVNAIYESVGLLLKDNKLRASMGYEAEKIAQEFTTERMIAEIEDVFKKELDGCSKNLA